MHLKNTSEKYGEIVAWPSSPVNLLAGVTATRERE
jgi:hypothetical protein